MKYVANPDRYQQMRYNRLGKSGLRLPAISLGLWHNFGDDVPHQTKVDICTTAFDLGITHFDLANNYGPPPGSAEKAFGRMLKEEFAGLRDEMILSSKSGYLMWDGPYGEWGSRKNMIASCDQTLKRLGVDYVDIFYSHRFDPETPLVETMQALDHLVRAGKALYVGISSYNAARTREAYNILTELGTPFVIHQPSYSMLNRWVETDGLLDTLEEVGLGSIVFSPLAQGMLTNKYLRDIPQGSRASQAKSLSTDFLSEENLTRVKALHELAEQRGQTLAQMAIAWVLRDKRVSSALIGASNAQQVVDCVGALAHLDFSDQELAAIDRYALDSQINIWTKSAELDA
ncbi:L-glyceraldehyde 3-phosphate reductase [Sphingobacterium griseoflavum]|uniref:Glyceraldehyde 3-phosphate reductase n=1 Tax=Sphingobacterium griseoflavum TaxID=1474952 RepID=A0ABQ3HV89_9SPHI|nr:L-glyceraldehyde 3-phosphate reductase [Sphingobacterium griseoflavum]GHE30939.1 glyceraldehyde 3-phosphate reductase [Sphingobacterium griseoflavum]